jgi:hypothetical protein
VGRSNEERDSHIEVKRDKEVRGNLRISVNGHIRLRNHQTG